MVPLHERWAKPKKEGLVRRIISARRAPTAERQREQDKEAWGMSRPERERRLMVDIWYKRFPQPDWIESPAAREARIDQVARTMKLDAFDSRTWELECPNQEVARQREQQPERARDRCPERDYGPPHRYQSGVAASLARSSFQIRSESEREEDAAKRRRKNIEEANGISVPVHRWFFPVVFTALFFRLFGDFVQEMGDRLRIIFFA